MTELETNKLKLAIPHAQHLKYEIIEFHGELDSYSLKLNRDKVVDIAKNLAKEILVFNFHDLDFVNSESVSFIMQIHDLLGQKNKKLIIVQAKPNVQDILSVVGLFESVPYYPSLLDFLKTL